MIQVRNVVIPAGVNGLLQQWAGRYLQILTSSEDLNIKASDGGRLTANCLDVPAGFGFGSEVEKFTDFQITTVSGAAGVAKVAVADTKAEFNLLVSTINVIDTSSPKFAAVAKRGYECQFGMAGAAGKYSTFQIKNNGVHNLVLTGVNLYTDAAPTGLFAQHQAAGADLANPVFWANRFTGGPLIDAGTSTTYDNVAGAIFNPSRRYVIQTQSVELDFDDQIVVIAPGFQYVFQTAAQNVALRGTVTVEQWLPSEL